MKKLLIKISIFLIPLPIYIGLLWFVDPFNYMGKNNFIPGEIKKEVSKKLNPFLWKLVEFDQNKAPRIILGDSRAAKIREELIKSRTGLDYYNFAYQGGTLLDMIETFWYVDSKVRLEEVYMGINFNLYNEFEKKNNVRQANDILKNYFSYTFSKIVLNCAVKCVVKKYFQEEMTIGMPDMDKHTFWNYEMDVIGKRFYQKYHYPEEYHEELMKISGYCKTKGIKLVFFMPPNHVEWQNRPADFGLEEENVNFIKDIEQMGTLYNLDVSNAFTSDRSNFLDPMHCIDDSLLICTIWAE